MRDRGMILAHFGNYGHRHEKLHQKSSGKHIHTQSPGRSRRGTGRWFRLRERDAGSRVQREVNAWRVTLDERGLGSSSIIVRMSAIRKLAAGGGGAARRGAGARSAAPRKGGRQPPASYLNQTNPPPPPRWGGQRPKTPGK